MNVFTTKGLIFVETGAEVSSTDDGRPCPPGRTHSADGFPLSVNLASWEVCIRWRHKGQCSYENWAPSLLLRRPNVQGQHCHLRVPGL